MGMAMQSAELLQTFAGLLRQYTLFVLRRASLPSSYYEDIYQDLSVDLWRAYRRFDPTRGKLANFLTVAIRNQARELVPSYRHGPTLTNDHADDVEDISLGADQHAWLLLKQVSSGLSHAQRRTLGALTGALPNFPSEVVLADLRARKTNAVYNRPVLDALASVSGKSYGSVRKNLKVIAQHLS